MIALRHGDGCFDVKRTPGEESGPSRLYRVNVNGYLIHRLTADDLRRIIADIDRELTANGEVIPDENDDR